MAYTTIDNPFKYFNTVLYSGTGSSQSITGVGFQPDWLWIKRRDDVGSHRIQDSIRGTANYLQSDKTDAEASGGDVDAFLSNGFSLSGGATAYNVSGGTYVGWSWLGGGSASSNSDGSITSSVSASTTAGFSVCSWTGNSGTIGHGLGVKPAMIIVKSRQTANNWVVLHKGLTGGMDANGIVLNSTAAETSGGSGMAEPTSSVFTITSGLAANDNNIGYVFAEKKGYSKFGSYTGNGNADGAFVYTGFKPAWIMVKRTGGVTNWQIQDSKRDGFNDQNKRILANVNEAEKTSQMWDQLSNGFKIRVTSENANGSGMSYIYMAFAEAPFVTAGTKAAGTAR
jgi:hypothetical protein